MLKTGQFNTYCKDSKSTANVTTFLGIYPVYEIFPLKNNPV